MLGQDDEFVILVDGYPTLEPGQSWFHKGLFLIMHLPSELVATPRVVQDLWIGMLLIGGIAALGFGIYFYRVDKARRARRREARRQARRAARLKRR